MDTAKHYIIWDMVEDLADQLTRNLSVPDQERLVDLLLARGLELPPVTVFWPDDYRFGAFTDCEYCTN